jgi:hypothetical protein
MNQHVPRPRGITIAQLNNSDNASADASDTVGVHLRILTAGVERIDNRDYMRATILISPGAKASTPISSGRAAHNVSLSKWPKQIEEMLFGQASVEFEGRSLSGLRINFAAADQKLESCPPIIPLQEGQEPIPVLRASKISSSQRGKDLNEIQTLWTTLLTARDGQPGSSSEFEELAEEFTIESGKSSAQTMLNRLDPKPPAPTTGQPLSTAAPDVVNTARNVLGVMLPMERALCLKERLQELVKTTALRPLETNLAYLPSDPFDVSEPWPSFLGEPPLLRQLAQAVGPTQNDAPLLFTLSHKEKVREAEKKVAQSVVGAVSKNEVADRLKNLLQQRKVASQPLSVQQNTLNTRSMSAALNRELDRHVLTTTRSDEDIFCRKQEVDKDGRPGKVDEKCVEDQPDKLDKLALSKAVRQRFAALQMQPSLARLFNLACDVLIPWENVANTIGSIPPIDIPLYRLVTIGQHDEARMWITTKFVLDVDAPDAWPCTTDEVLIQLADSGIGDVNIEDGSVEQLDGFVPLAAKSGTGDQAAYRYEIMTLDVERAAEQRITAEASRYEGEKTPAEAAKRKLVENPDDSDRNRMLTLRTAGVAIADRQRAIDVTRAIRRSRNRAGKSAPCIIGAEDLTVGYRLDVGVPGKDGSVSLWQPLCNRTIRFGDLKAKDFSGQQTIEAILARLEPNQVRRARLDAATIAPVTRLDSKDNTDVTPITAHVEDQIARWLGQPLGVDTDTDPGYVLGSSLWNTDVPIYPGTGALPLTQVFSLDEPKGWKEVQKHLEKSDRPAEPWRGLGLRFGVRYSFRMRAVLAGGVVRPVNAATLPIQSLPSKSSSSNLAGFRFRRHERIEKPLISTPEKFLREPFDGVEDGLRETGGSAIVRTFAGEAPRGTTPRTSTIRLFAPPPVALEFAELHEHDDAFGIKPDDVEYVREVKPTVIIDLKGKDLTVSQIKWKGPKDGLRGLKYSHTAGGFPVFSFERNTKGELEAKGSKAEPWRKRNGDAVCIPVTKDDQRAEPFYPDPAAEFMVFGLRDAAGQFTDDQPVVVRLRKSGEPAVACRPVAVEISAGEWSKLPVNRTRIWAGDGEAPLRSVKPKSAPELSAPFYMDVSGKLSSAKPAGDALAVSRVRVRLAPGEQFRLEAWCIPNAKMLGKLFEVVNGLAMLGIDKDDQCRGKSEVAAATPSIPRAVPCSPAHLPPDQGAIDGAADKCFQELCRGPMPELVATAQVEITHALDKPYEPAAAPDIKLVRLSTAQLTNALLAKSELKIKGIDQPAPTDSSTWFDLPKFFGNDSEGDPLKVIPGSTEVLVSGPLTVDRTVTGFIETEALGPCLISGRFDDTARKRTRNEFLRGIWPTDLSLLDDKTTKPIGKTILSIYGFDVDGEGRVTHALEKATLLRLDDAPLLGSNRLAALMNSAGKDRKERLFVLQETKRNYRQLQAIAKYGQENPDPLLPRANYPSLIPDTLARVMTVEIVAGSRTSTFFRKPETDAVYFGQDATTRSKPSRRIPIPSTAAPASVVPMSIVPSFRLVSEALTTSAGRGGDSLSDLKVVVKRHIRLRIRLQRPWFSSGVGERLGIVLWPPDLALYGPGDRVTDGDSILRDYGVDFWSWQDKTLMAVRSLEDHKMPPEWGYVTRWGLDPIRRRETKHPWLLPPTALPAIRDRETKWHNSTYPSPGTEWDVLGDFQRVVNNTKSLIPELERDVVYVGRAQIPFPDPTENKAVDKLKDGPAVPAVVSPDTVNEEAPRDQREVGTFSQSQYFSAALLTMRPRFDLDQECWYCDLDIDPMGASYPFVRLGLVRYQPLAPEKLQVSPPVMEWAQIPPRREVVMTRSPLNPNAVMLEVRGPGAHMAAQALPHSIFSWLHQPALKVTLCWRDANGREEIARLGKWDSPKITNDIYTDHPFYSPYAVFDFIPQTQEEWETYLSVGQGPADQDEFDQLKRRSALRRTATDASNKVGDIVWRGVFVLDRSPVPQKDGSWLVAHIEEVEPMLPASYPEEPHVEDYEKNPDLIKAQRIEVSGPKFAATVHFKR